MPIDPVELKLGKTTYRTIVLKGVFGALRDAGPDYWGRRVIEKHAGKPQLGGRDVLLVKRFDREKTDQGYLRARMISGLTLLGAGDSHQHRERWSYVLMAEELRRVSAHPKQDAAGLFRRMVFNALISNIDDYPRNHAIIAKEADWKLSPAYDLTPSMPVSQERRDLALSCGDRGRYAHAENLLSQCQRFYLGREQADAW